jgi:glycosyltransferase involved in cell wall biosynthesis
LRLVLLFERLQNFHLLKDVGLVPYLLGSELACTTEIVCFNDNEEWPYLVSPLADLDVRFIGGKNARSEVGLIWLWKNAAQIDILMLFHISTKTIYRGVLYKIMNRNGYLYIKADIASEQVGYGDLPLRLNIISWIKRWLLAKIIFTQADLVSVECRRTFDHVRAIPKTRLIHIPNGFWRKLSDLYAVYPRDYQLKKNRILLVARHGSYEKNSELMLSAVALLCKDNNASILSGWELCFVGPATDKFLDVLRGVQCRLSECKVRILYVGNIVEKDRLYELYAGSKIFVLPSRKDSFPLACCEALYYGNAVIITKELICSTDFSDGGRSGLTFANDDAMDLAAQLEKLLLDDALLKRLCDHAMVYAREHLVWEDIMSRLATRIRSDLAASNILP